MRPARPEVVARQHVERVARAVDHLQLVSRLLQQLQLLGLEQLQADDNHVTRY